jgi:hypothetical protein
MNNLTLEEQALLDSFEQEEWISHPHFEDRKKELQEYASNTLQLRKIFEITLSKNEWAIFERLAVKAGTSSATFMNSVLHQFIENHPQVEN